VRPFTRLVPMKPSYLFAITANSVLVFAALQPAASADQAALAEISCPTTSAASTGAKHIIHESKIASLALKNSGTIRIASASVLEDPEEEKKKAAEEKARQIQEARRAAAARVAAMRAAQGLENRKDEYSSSPMLRTLMRRVPAGPNSPFRVPIWLTVKRPQAQAFDSATLVPTANPAPTVENLGKVKAAAAVPNNALPKNSLNQQGKNSNADSIFGEDGEKLLADSDIAGPSYTDSSATDLSKNGGALTPQQAVMQDPDASGKPKIAQNDPNSAPTADNPYPFAPEGTKRRAYPAPLDPVFPMTEWLGVGGTLPIGVPDTDPEYPLEKAIYKVIPQLKKHRIKIYGWSNPGVGYSTSKLSNIPNSYNIVPRRLELDQQIMRFERVPDTVQTEHMDWGFRATVLYGIDYRWTTAQGWYPATKELLQHNYLYGMDPVELYGMVYFPKVCQGMVTKFGRFISPPDIEAQLAPDNFLWTHSQMFTDDCYTQTGLINAIKLNDNWTLQAAITAGADIAPWDKAAVPTGLFLARWVSKSNNDSIYGGVNSINNGRFRGARAVLSQQQMISSVNQVIQQSAALNGGTPDTSVGNFTNFDGSVYQFNNLQPPAHDNLQQFNLTWQHRFNRKGTIVTMTEAYFIYQYNALVGGTVNNGPPHTFNQLTGPGNYINGIAPAVGLVNYTAFKVSDKDYFTIRPVDFLLDYKGERTGFQTAFSSWTIGWCHRFNNLVCIRPEIRYDRALNYNNQTIVKPYDNGRRRFQFQFGFDVIARY
jgi:hypothetical protein